MKLALSILSLVFVSSSVFAVQGAATSSLQDMFNARLKLRQQFISGQLSSEDGVKIKAQITESRYNEDLLGEALEGNQRRPLDQKSPPAFSVGQTTILNPNVKTLSFQSGDVLMVRGLSTISTTIASITDSPSGFSHSLIIYLNPADQKMYTIEALIGKGTVIMPFEETLNEGLPHMVLYRHPDAALANQAAKIIYERATAALQAGQSIPYATSLTFEGYEKMTCAQLVRMGFDLASGGTLKMPSFPSTLGGRYPNIAAALGFPRTVIPLEWPADFDSQKDLEMIAETRDFQATLNFRIKDQIILSLLDWIEQGVVGHDFSKMLTSSNQSSSEDSLKKMTRLAGQADEVVNALTTQVLKANDQQLKKTGRNMSASEIKNYMGKIRQSSLVEKVLQASGFSPKPASCQKVLM